MKFGASPNVAHGMHAFSHALARAFPTPGLLSPPAAGIDISDSSVKWLVLAPEHDGLRVASFGEMGLEAGIVVSGAVKSVEGLAAKLSEVRRQLHGVRFAHTALPEEAAYVFEMHIPEGTSRREAKSLIEFEFEGRVPLSPQAAVFDFDIIQKHDDGEGEDIGVSVFPLELAESYTNAFDASGMSLVSLELEARSIARAVIGRDESVTLLVDFGRARTGFAVVKRGIPIFTSTVDAGGDTMARALKEAMGLSPEDAIVFRNAHGLVPEGGEKSKGLDALVGVASALSDEILRHYHYWDTRRNERGERMTPVAKVVFVGGSANLRGLTDYIAGRVQAPTFIGDVWHSVGLPSRIIPPIDKRTSLQYAAAIGLALRSFIV